MANYPNKPWSDGQTFEVVPGETFVYDATQGVWTHQTKATLDSDYQVDKAVIQSDISANTSAIAAANTRIDVDSDALVAVDARLVTAEGDISTLQAQVTLLDGMSDSDAARIQQNIADINTAFAMLDSDGLNLQALRTDLDAEIAATNADVTTLTARLDSDETVVQSLRTDLDAEIAATDAEVSTINARLDSDETAIQAISIRMPVVSATAPVGASGVLWINTTDGKLYYWNDSDAFVSIVTT